MYLVDDLGDARRRYEAMGFETRPTGDEGCVGFCTGATSVILLNRDYAQRTLPDRAIAILERQPALYIWVESLEAMRGSVDGTILGEHNLAGLREWAVESDQGLMVFAETTAG